MTSRASVLGCGHLQLARTEVGNPTPSGADASEAADSSATIVQPGDAYRRAFRANGVRRFDFNLIDPTLSVGSRIMVWHLAGPLLQQWASDAGLPFATDARVGRRGTVVGWLSDEHVRFLRRLYRQECAEPAPTIAILFDDAPLSLDGESAHSSMNLVPAALCLTLPHALIPWAHRRVTQDALEAELGREASREWLIFRTAKTERHRA